MNIKAILSYGLFALVVATILVDLIVGKSDLRQYTVTTLIVYALTAGTYLVIRKGIFPFVVRRLMQAAFVLWVIVSATFLLLRFLPGGPFDSEKALPPEVKANIEAKYNLNAPLPEQYIAYIGKLLRGDFGESYKFIGRDVTDIISESLPVSFQLGLYAILISFMIGIPLGVFAASKHNTILDNGAMIVAMSGVALPSFLVAPVLILIFSYHLGWLPPALWIGPVYYILPVVTLGVRPAAIIARLTRSSVLDTIHSDFVRTAKAKGLGWRTVLFKHVLKNSLIPVITIAAPLVAQILSGTFIIELIFAIPGMGKHFIQSVTNRDYPLVLGVTIVYATLLVLANLLVDVLYAFLDPRIKLS